MPRVIAGTVKGRRLRGPVDERVRPTTDRTKEALFSILLPVLLDARVLDLYAGSGALAIEALSRGAASAVLVEQDHDALVVLHDNLDVTGMRGVATVLQSDVLRALRGRAATAAPYDVVLVDPPYAATEDEVATLLATLVPLVAAGGVVSLERGHRAPAPTWPLGLVPREPRRYGTSMLHLADRTSPADAPPDGATAPDDTADREADPGGAHDPTPSS